VLPSIPKQILVRVGLLLVSLVALLLCALAGLQIIEQSAMEQIVDAETEEHRRLLDSALQITGRPLQLFVDGYSRRTTFTRPEEEKRGASPESTLNTGLRSHELAVAWVLEADGTVRHHVAAEGESLNAVPLTPAQLSALKSYHLHFFLTHQGVPYEVRGERLAASAVRPNAPRGWLIASRRLDGAALAHAILPLGCALTVVPAEEARAAPADHAMRIERLLAGFTGAPVAKLRLECTPPEITLINATRISSITVIGGFALCALALCALCLWRWVIHPAAVLNQSLAQRDPKLLQPLAADGGDFGLLAELIRDSMDARRQLESTLEERARLSRELHDGVIQTIYAAGMNVAGARALIMSDPAAADHRLERTCVALNATVHDVRNFILGLEAEPERARTFRQSVELILSLLRPIRPIDFQVDIDDAVCARLTPPQRHHMLQILREALSNSLRHSTAEKVCVRVQADLNGSSIEIVDDGAGFDLAGANDGGHGLKNLAARAAEIGGALSIGKVEPRGTRIRLTLPAALEP
jgi:signal transduction histidine kinase